MLLGATTLVAVGAAVVFGTSQKSDAGASVFIRNETGNPTHVFVSFGADSVVKAADWASFCTVRAPLNCDFMLPAGGLQPTAGHGKYTNATISFDGQGCDTTKAEINVSNPKWYNILDVSLVDGYSNKIKITSTSSSHGETVIGPPAGKTGNEKIMGVFPFGCDICTAMQHPPCGIVPGGPGCHAGTQFNPDPVCQWQGPVMGPQDNSRIVVALVK